MESNRALKLGSGSLSYLVRSSLYERYGAARAKHRMPMAIKRSVTPFEVLTLVCLSESHMEILVAKKVCIIALKIELNMSLLEIRVTSF